MDLVDNHSNYIRNLILVIIPFYLVAFWAQNNLPLHGDVNYLINTANFILSGKKYGIDFFETNPPMILYLYFPVLSLAKLTNFNIAICLKAYVFFLSFCTLLLSLYSLKEIIKNSIVLNIFISTMLFAILLLPINQFGQREHLFCILILPYLFSAVLRLNDTRLPFLYAVIVGLFAGLGFGIKPYFLFPLVFIEFYFILKRKSMWGWVRVESLLIMAILVTYLLSTIIFFPTYFTVVLPLINKFYFIGVQEPLNMMLSNVFVIFSIVSFFSCFILFRVSPHHRLLKTILMLSLGGFIVGLIATRTSWYYHSIPSYSMACILLGLYFGEFVANSISRSSNKIYIFLEYVFITIAGLMLFYIPLSYTRFYSLYYANQAINSDLAQLTSYIASQPGEHSVICFSANTTGDCFPLTLSSQSSYGSRYPFFWWMRGLVATLNDSHISKRDKEMNKNYFSESIAKDLDHFQARWVIINTHVAHVIFGDNFSFITFFSDNKNFHDAWSHYRIKSKIGVYEVYERT